MLGCLALTLILSSHSHAEEIRPLIPRAALFSKITTEHVKVSPDGSQMSFMRFEPGSQSVWVAPVSQIDQAKRVGQDLPGTPHNCWWSVDGTQLILWQEVEPGVAHLIRVNNETGEHLDLTPIPKTICRFVRLSSAFPHDILVKINDRDPKINDLWRVNLLTGKRSLVMEMTGFRKVYVDAQFKPRIAEKEHHDRGVREIDLFVLSPPQAPQLLRSLSYDEVGFSKDMHPVIGLNPAGSHLFLVDRSERDKSALYELKIQTGEKKILAEDADADIAMNAFGESFSISNPYTNQLLAVSSFFDRARRHSLNSEVAADFQFLEEHFGVQVGVNSMSADNETWIVHPYDGGPHRFHVYQRREKKVSFIHSQFAELAGHKLGKRSIHLVKTRDGLRLPCHLYLPPGTDQNDDGFPDSPIPTMMWVHGGPNIFYSWNGWFTNRHLQLLADRGYASLRVEFRGTDGLGRTVRHKGYRQWGGDAHNDLVDIARWAVEKKIARQGEVGIWGWSYGGYATNAATVLTPKEFKCGISMYGVSSLESLITQSGKPEDTAWWRTILGDDRTNEGKVLLRRQSPLNHAKRAGIPLLITCGGKDVLVPHNVQTEPFARRLLELGKPVTYLYYPDEPHDYRKEENWTSFWAISEHFLAKHLGGRSEPFNDDLTSGSLQVKFGADHIPGLAAR